jgi:hypothetical protein
MNRMNVIEQTADRRVGGIAARTGAAVTDGPAADRRPWAAGAGLHRPAALRTGLRFRESEPAASFKGNSVAALPVTGPGPGRRGGGPPVTVPVTVAPG